MSNLNLSNTYSIFKSSKIACHNTPESKYVKATEDIEEGDILLMEHCYAATNMNSIISVFKFDPDLYDNLHPRKDTWREEMLTDDSKELEMNYAEKAQNNLFGLQNGKYFVLGNEISNFNHNTAPNSYMSFIYDIDKKLEQPFFILYVISDRKIKKGEEVTIWFGDNFSLGKEYKSNEDTLKPKYIDKIHTKINEYLKTDTCKRILFKHLCMFNGLYLVKDIKVTTPRFIEYFTRTTKTPCDNKNIGKWFSFKVDQISDYLQPRPVPNIRIPNHLKYSRMIVMHK